MHITKPFFSLLSAFPVLGILFLACPGLANEKETGPITQWLAPSRDNPGTLKVKSFYGNYSVSGKISGVPAPSLRGPVSESWHSAKKALKPYRIAVIFPHLKDPYWIAVNYGIAYQARQLGVAMDLKHPGGYRNLGKQVKQMEFFLENGQHQGLIIGAVQYKKSKLEKIYKRYQQAGIPIVSVVNDSYTPTINGKSIVSWQELGYQAGEFLLKHSANRNIKVAIMPGAKGTGWAPDSLQGFNQAINEQGAAERIEILPALWGDTGDKAQRHQVKVLLKNHNNIDYIIGNALAVNAAVTPDPDGSPAPVTKFKASHPELKLISTYITQDVYDHIMDGKILASSADLMKDQGVMAMDMMVRILNGQKTGEDMPFRMGPEVPIIHQDNIDEWSYERLFGPRDFKPLFSLK